MKSPIKYIQSNLFNVANPEWPRVLSTSTFFLILMFGCGFGHTARDAYFIKEVGFEKLPQIYVISAISIILASSFYSRIVDRISRYRLFVILLIFFATLLILLRLIIPLNYPWTAHTLYCIAEVTIILLVFLHFWTVANDVFNLREGKRIFPLIGGAGLTGMILSGACTKPLVSVIGTANLFLVWAIVLLLLIPSVIWIRKTAVASGTLSAKERNQETEEIDEGFIENLKTVWSLPLLRSLAYMSIPLWLVSYFVNFQFFNAMDEVFIDQDQLSGFLGIFSCVTSLVGLFLQLFITSRLLRRYGIGFVMLIHPISVTIGSIFLNLRNILTPTPVTNLGNFRAMSATFARFSDEEVLTSIAESSTQIIFNAVPGNKRGRARAFISGTVEPLGGVLAGFLLMIFVAINTPPLVVSLATLLLCFLWIYLVLKVKSNYFQALVNNLTSPSLNLRNSAIDHLGNLHGPEVTRILAQSLMTRDIKIALFALDLLKKTGDEKLPKQLIDVIPHVAPKIRIATLSLISEIGNRETLTLLRPLFDNKNSDVKAAAINTYCKLGNQNDIMSLESFLDSQDVYVRSEVQIAIINNFKGEKVYIRAYDMLIDMIDNDTPLMQAKAAYIIGETGLNEFAFSLLKSAESSDQSVKLAVINACGKIGDERVVSHLISLLNEDKLTQPVVNALIELGDAALDQLHGLISNPNVNDNTKIHILSCLSKTGSLETIKCLLNSVEGNNSSCIIELETVDALALIKSRKKWKYEHGIQKLNQFFRDEMAVPIAQQIAKMTRKIIKESLYLNVLRSVKDKRSVYLLIDALTRLNDVYLNTAMKYIELLGDARSVKTAAINMKSDDRLKRAQALEVLEGSCDEAKDLVEFLESSYDPNDKIDKNISPTEILKELLDHSDYWVKTCAIFAIGEVKLSRLVSQLYQLKGKHSLPYNSEDQKLISDSGSITKHDDMIRVNINLALSKLDVKSSNNNEVREIDNMSIIMRKMLFLRSVSLFSNIDGADLEFICDITNNKSFSANETVFEEDDEGDALYLIERGSVKVVTGTKREVVLGILQERDYFGEMSILNREPRSASVIAQTEVDLLFITQEDFHRLLLARPEIGISLFKTLSYRLRTTLNKLSASQRKEVFDQTTCFDAWM